MAEYIEREALLEKAKELSQTYSSSCLASVHIIKAIENAPKADVVEVKHGEWELHGNDDSLGCSYFCSSCWWNMDEDEFLDNWSHFKYCPNCGAKMDLKEGAE